MPAGGHLFVGTMLRGDLARRGHVRKIIQDRR
jgi:hypothetical protein